MRKINKRFYGLAGVITIIIFLFGLSLGILIESERVDYVEGNRNYEKVEYESLQVQYLYLSYLSSSGREESCGAFAATLNQYIKRTDDTRLKLEDYIAKGNVYTEEFSLLKREYIQSQMNYWILARKTKELCKTDYVTVLYFHSTDCPDCKSQGYVLDYMKKLFDDRLLVFAFDANFTEEPMIDLLKNTYNLERTPTVVVEDDSYAGFVSKDELMKKVCAKYQQKPKDCPEQ
jgi:thiol-disulfide isomerase/thioredoxin